MRGDPWHREPPLHATTVEGVLELLWSLHDSYIDVEELAPERIDRVMVSYRIPLAFDQKERRRDPWPWELIIRNPRSLLLEDEWLISVYGINQVEVTPERIALTCDPDLKIAIRVSSLDVAVEPRATS
jgi:hypothetical protein